jgi:lysophospholipase L1-like esterase
MAQLKNATSKIITAFGVLAGQVMYAGHRRDLPSLENQDPSGWFGAIDNPVLRVALLGDSSVTAPGVEPLDAAWPRQLAQYLSDRYRVELCTVAVGGSKVRDVLAGQVEAAVAAAPHIAIVSVGANDALRATPIPRFERDYDTIIRQLAAAIPGVAVSGVGDLGIIPRLPALARAVARIRARSVDRAIARVVSRYPKVLKTDTYSAGWDDFYGHPDKVFAADLFHASAYGHRTYAAAMVPAVEALLADGSIEATG